MNQVIQPVLADQQSLDNLMKTIRIPPRPSLLVEMQEELRQEDPSAKGLATIISKDVALAASLMKLTNSSFLGLRLKAQSIDHAVSLIGTKQTGLLMTGIIARQSVNVGAKSLGKFWETSSKRAQAMSTLARRAKVCSADVAHTFGLFCDIGVPILMERFPAYEVTWKEANSDFDTPLTALEDRHHITNHASIGSLMARTWGLPEQVSTAILLHHDYAILEDTNTEESVRGLIALSSLAEFAIQKYEGQETSPEWHKAGVHVCQYLGIDQQDVEDWCEELHVIFNQAH
jgi:HD-like signal output (HDOD) protein